MLLAKAEQPIRICVTQDGTSCPQRVGPATAGRLCRLIFARSAIRSPSVRAGLAFSGEADPTKKAGVSDPGYNLSPITNHS